MPMDIQHKSHIEIDTGAQQLRLVVDGKCRQSFSVSTALNGTGQQHNSGQTPLGWHRIAAKIGTKQPSNAVFVGRSPTGEIYDAALANQHPKRDWILTRILWLQGQEPHKNLGGDVDTLNRFIYIHGTPDTEPMGEARSHGCIRMRNDDVLALFDLVQTGCPVNIV